jgi:hypothetical protein
MKTTLTTTHAAGLLADDPNSSFSLPGAYALVEYLEQMEEDTGEDMEFCHVEIRCDYCEYETLREWGEDYFGGWNNLCAEFGDEYCGPLEDETPEDFAERFDDVIREYIERRGILIEFDGGIIVSSF